MKTKSILIVALICSLSMLTSCFFPGPGGKDKKSKQPVKVEQKKDHNRR